MKLLGIINVALDITDRLLMIYFVFGWYWRKMGVHSSKRYSLSGCDRATLVAGFVIRSSKTWFIHDGQRISFTWYVIYAIKCSQKKNKIFTHMYEMCRMHKSTLWNQLVLYCSLYCEACKQRFQSLNKLRFHLSRTHNVK